jgi:hypothetical protein
LETDGTRWTCANDLEQARRRKLGFFRDEDDPLGKGHPLDDPKPEWAKFLQHPRRRKFVSWRDFRVNVEGESCPVWTSQTVVSYYSSWQLLLFLECSTMGVKFLGNTEEWNLGDEVPESFVRGDPSLP